MKHRHAIICPLLLVAAAGIVPTATATTFTKVVSGPVVTDASESTGGAWEDYDGDGDPDLFVACSNLTPANNRLYRNDFGLFFALVPGPVGSDNTPSNGGTWGDLENDGDPDLFVVNREGVNELLYRKDGGDVFSQITTGGPVTSGGNSNSAWWVEIDRDGALDLYVINFNETRRHWRNDGTGSFTEILTGAHVSEVTLSISGMWSDYDRDGDQDCYIANGGTQNERLYRNDGTTFVNVTAAALLQHGGATIGASWADWTNDGWPDLLAANTLGQHEFLYRNLGDGTFERILAGPVVADAGNSVGSAFADMDNDGDLDLFLGNDGQDNALFRNDGGSFTKLTTGAIVTDGGATFGVSWADWNSDGWLDAFAANRLGQDDFLYTNDGGANHWLELKLVGTISNRSAIGARVEAFAEIGGQSVLQSRERASQSGYNSASDPRLHFGLGDATVVDSLKVAWPSGLAETWWDVAADQILTLVEGATLTGVLVVPRTGELRAAPNPARGATVFRASSFADGLRAIRILDIRGRLVRLLRPERGRSEVAWDGRDADGRAVSAGVYFAVVECNSEAAVGRVTMLR